MLSLLSTFQLVFLLLGAMVTFEDYFPGRATVLHPLWWNHEDEVVTQTFTWPDPVDVIYEMTVDDQDDLDLILEPKISRLTSSNPVAPA